MDQPLKKQIIRRKPMSFTQHHLSFALGSEIKGLDLSQAIDQSTIQTLRKTLAERGFLLFRNQDITPEQHIAFTKQFGGRHEK